jgi:hypothetical protein
MKLPPPGAVNPASSSGRSENKTASAVTSGARLSLEGPPLDARSEPVLKSLQSAPAAQTRAGAGDPEKADGLPSPGAVPPGDASVEEALWEQTGGAPAFDRLTRALGLPRDALSAVLLPFAHSFLLPLESTPLLKLRRQVLSAKTRREAAALGAAAAAAKGLELSPPALRRYAAAIDPGLFSGEAPGNDRERGDDPEESSLAGELRKKAAALAREEPLLNTLNRVPAAGGRYWMVFPFTLSAGNARFNVSVRVLLTGKAPDAAGRVERLAVDVAGERRRWLFILDKPGLAGAETRLCTEPPLGKAVFRGVAAELEAALGDWGGRVLQAADAGTALFPDAREGGYPGQQNAFPFINMEV